MANKKDSEQKIGLVIIRTRRIPALVRIIVFKSLQFCPFFG